MTYDQIEALNATLTASRLLVARYVRSVANYEKGIKRLRRGVWSGRKAKDRVKILEDLILGASCRHDIDKCVRWCDTGSYQLHSEGRAIRKQRKYPKSEGK